MNFEEEMEFLKKEKTSGFVTSDFYLTAFLSAKGFKIIATKWITLNRLGFEFDNIEDVNNLVNNFVLGKTEINTREFINALRDVKGIINQAKFSKVN